MKALRNAVGLLLAASVCLLLPATGQAKTYTYKVKHLHAMGSCQGLLIVGEDEVRYETDYRQDARIWTYDRIKKVERKDSRHLTIETYEDQSLQFGRDKPFDFEFLDGEVSQELVDFMAMRMARSSPPPPPTTPPGGRWELAVKHKHMFGGCEGTLKITDSSIQYVTDDTSDARLWKYLDIKRVENPSTYELDIYTYEDQTLQLGRDKVFHFELKEPLKPEVFEFIQQHLSH